MEFDIRIIIDTREKDLSYVGEIDKRRRKDGTKIIEIEQKTCYPKGCKKSTADITFEYRVDRGEWTKASFGIEIKKRQDMIQSISTVAKYDRLLREAKRAKEADIDFYFICNADIGILVKDLKRLEENPRNKIRRGSHITFIKKYVQFNNDLVDLGYKEGIIVCTDLWMIVRRLIKNHIEKEKILKKY